MTCDTDILPSGMQMSDDDPTSFYGQRGNDRKWTSKTGDKGS